MQRFLLISVVLLFLALLGARASADFTIPEPVLLSDELSVAAWGPATVARTNPPGDGVQFDFSGLTGSSTGIKDDYPVQDYGQILPSHGNGDFSEFDGYALWVRNIGATEVSFSLFMNTGFTGPSGVPSNDLTNDTFWQSLWQHIQPGESSFIRLDFDHAKASNIADNKFPHTLGTEGGWTAINDYDRREVSSIGFQVTGSGDGAIVVSPVPEPASMILGAVGMSTAGWLMQRRRERSY